MWLSLTSNASASIFASLPRARWQPLRSHQASSDSSTSLAVQCLPTSITRLQNASLARAIPPETPINNLCVRTSLLNPLMYAW